jgi:hypothetical protein
VPKFSKQIVVPVAAARPERRKVPRSPHPTGRRSTRGGSKGFVPPVPAIRVATPRKTTLSSVSTTDLGYPTLDIYPAVYPHFNLYPEIQQTPEDWRIVTVKLPQRYPALQIYEPVYPYLDIYDLVAPQQARISSISMQLGSSYPFLVICTSFHSLIRFVCSNIRYS